MHLGEPAPHAWNRSFAWSDHPPVGLALTDATIDNGCPHVVPGVHRRGTLAHRYVEPLGFECLEDPVGAVAVPVPAGGADPERQYVVLRGGQPPC